MTGRKRTWTDEQFIKAVAESRSVAQVLKNLGLNPTGANYQTVHLTVERLSLDTSHWKGQGWNRGGTSFPSKIPLEEILVEESTYLNTGSLKSRLLNAHLLEYRCYECSISQWNGKPLSLQLDHRNGIRRDNRIENLRLLCPNCHSQTDTFCRRK